MTHQDLAGLGARPIRPEAPAGSPGRDEPEFETMQAQIRRLELPDGQQPDWPVVVRCATTLLADKTKDLLPACYLCVGLLQEEGYEGLVTGLTILTEMVESHWESLFPEIKRMRGRAAAFEWLGERGARAVAMRSPGANASEVLDLCRVRVARLTELLDQKMDGGGGLLGELRRSLEEAGVLADGQGGAAGAAAAAQAGGIGTASTVPTEIRTPEEAARAQGDLKDLARRLAEFYRANEPGNPMGYRLPRMTGWMHLRELPPHESGRTQIPAPQPADALQRMEEMLSKGQWAGVLEQTESRFPTAILWLDLERLAVAALEGMGEETLPAAQSICDELELLLKRLPGLEGLAFAGGQPLADPSTRAWIAARVRSGPAKDGGGTLERGGDGPGSAAADAGSLLEGDLAGFSEAREEARALAKRKKLDEALRRLEEGAARARTLRGRATWKLEAARICLETGRVETAAAHFRLLDEELGRARCEDWDPVLCLEVVKGLYLSHQKALSSLHPRPAEEIARSRELLGRLVRLDPVSALSLEERT